MRRLVRLGAWTFREKFTFGALVAVQNGEGRTLLVQQKLYERHLWTLPGGFLKSDEAPHLAAARELDEETGVQIALGAADEVAHYKQPWAQHLDVLFAATLPSSAAIGRLARLETRAADWFDLANDPPPLAAAAITATSILAGKRPSYLTMAWYRDLPLQADRGKT